MNSREDPRIIERLNENSRYPPEGCWERGCWYLYEAIRNYEDLAVVLGNNDTNTLLFAMQRIAPTIVGLLSSYQRRDLQSRLERHLGDKRMCEISSDCSQADEEDTTTVEEAASYALKILGEN